jgi:hypothetical protein
MRKPGGTVSRPATKRMDDGITSAFLTISPNSDFFKSWLWIGFLINAGAVPKTDDVVALLRSGVPPPPDDSRTLKYIADLIDEARGRGRPKKHPVQVEQRKRDQARKDIADIQARGSLANFARSKSITRESALDRYRKAKKTLRIARDEWDTLIESLRQHLNATGANMTKEQVEARAENSGFGPPPEK